jgi:energy-coupling factor transport system substrate-specific component
MISRYRGRFEFTWREATATSASLLAALAVGLPATDAQGRGVAPASRWLEHAQNRDGGFGVTPGAESSPAITGWAVLGLEGAGRNPLDLRRSGSSPIDYLRSQVHTLRSTGDLERTILALRGAGMSPRRLGGRDLVADLRRRRSPNGSFEGQVNLTAFGILALRAAGASASALSRSARWLREARNRDGGWGFQPQAASDPDSTGAVLQGLASVGSAGRITRKGVAYLRRAQHGNGGFALAAGGPTNSQSTAWAVQGLVAVGVDPATVKSRGVSPLHYLAKRQVADGHYRYSPSSDQTPVWVTSQALLAVNGKAFPLDAVPRTGSAGAPAGEGSRRAVTGRGAGPSARTAGSPARGGRARAGATGAGGPHAASGVAGELASGDTVSSRPAADASGGGKGSPTTAAYVGGAFALLTAALVGGFLWYRRRLP